MYLLIVLLKNEHINLDCISLLNCFYKSICPFCSCCINSLKNETNVCFRSLVEIFSEYTTIKNGILLYKRNAMQIN